MQRNFTDLDSRVLLTKDGFIQGYNAQAAVDGAKQIIVAHGLPELSDFRPLMRRQELDGFIEGLFGHEEVVDLPRRAHRGLDELGQMRALFEAVVHLVEGDTKQPIDKGVETTLRRMREMTKIAEHEIHAVVLACTRARKQMMAGMPTTRPTVH